MRCQSSNFDEFYLPGIVRQGSESNLPLSLWLWNAATIEATEYSQQIVAMLTESEYLETFYLEHKGISYLLS